MALPDFSGAKPSNAGDSFHELWALHAALALLESKAPLTAVTVEGIPAVDSVRVKDDAWSGVDCGLYFGGETFDSAKRIELIQLKYSSANPDKNWTVGSLTASTSTTKDNSVMRRLADQFIAAHAQRRVDPSKQTVVRFVTNRPISEQITKALTDFLAPVPNNARRKPRVSNANQEIMKKLRKASGLKVPDFTALCRVLVFEGGESSRFALREQLILAIGAWTNTNSRTQLDDLLQFIREHMMPESSRDRITKESLLARFGTSDQKSIFPCPQSVKIVRNPVPRHQATDVLRLIESGKQRILLHGVGGCGKTTVLQEVRSLLPPSSTESSSIALAVERISTLMPTGTVIAMLSLN